MARDANIDQLYYYGSNVYSNEDKIRLLDQYLDYQYAIKFTEEESELRTNLDSSYKKIISQEQLIESYKKEITNKDKRLELLLKELKNHCNKNKYYEILSAANLWNNKKDNK